MMYKKEELQKVIEQEETLRLEHCTYEDGIRLGETVFEIGARENLKICCQVIIKGFAVSRWFLDGTGPENIPWLERKKNTVLKEEVSSLRCGMEAELLGKERDWHQDTERYVIRGGGFPLRLTDGTFIGALCISGLEHQEDHKLAVRALIEYLRQEGKSYEN